MYSSRQIQCMQAIGLVPWVRRTADMQAVPQPAAPKPAASAQQLTADTLLLSSSNTDDQLVVCAGDTDSALLLIFDTRSSASSWPLSKADDALLEGMLRAIGLTKASVCSCAFLQSSNEQGQSLQALCQAPRKRFLYFGGETIAEDTIVPIPMTQSRMTDGVIDGVIDGWCLPSLATLREAPARKRHAWITLKQLRSALDHN